MRALSFSAALVVVTCLATPALAKDRAVTHQEKASLEAAVKSAGCTGGRMEFDDDRSPPHPSGKFEIDDAMCGNQKHDLVFDHDFKLISKEFPCLPGGGGLTRDAGEVAYQAGGCAGAPGHGHSQRGGILGDLKDAQARHVEARHRRRRNRDPKARSHEPCHRVDLVGILDDAR